jgi:Fe2+ or Zn2+ uptake regulation protein
LNATTDYLQNWKKNQTVSSDELELMQSPDTLMEVLEQLPSEWVETSKVYQRLESKEGKPVSRRTMRRWVKELQDAGYLKKRGRTRDREIYPLIEKK